MRAQPHPQSNVPTAQATVECPQAYCSICSIVLIVVGFSSLFLLLGPFILGKPKVELDSFSVSTGKWEFSAFVQLQTPSWFTSITYRSVYIFLNGRDILLNDSAIINVYQTKNRATFVVAGRDIPHTPVMAPTARDKSRRRMSLDVHLFAKLSSNFISKYSWGVMVICKDVNVVFPKKQPGVGTLFGGHKVCVVY